MIEFDQRQASFHLSNGRISFVLAIIREKYVLQRYLGSAIRSFHDSNSLRLTDRGFASNPDSTDRKFSVNELPLACPTRGTGDYRLHVLTIVQSGQRRHIDLSYAGYEILAGKPGLTGLPATYVEQVAAAETLKIELVDQIANVKVTLFYTIFQALDIIATHQEVTNCGQQPVMIENCQSLSLDLPPQKFDWLSLYGAHTKEANLNRHPLYPGIQKIESARGTSSPQHQPFFALMAPETTEYNGEVYAFHLIYSGNFMGAVEVDQYGNIRAQLGLNPDTFTWQLTAQETFVAPEVIINYSTSGLNGMSQNFQHLYQANLVAPQFRRRSRPILINTWETMHFDLTAEKCLDLARQAAKLGIELFVLDDGWFKGRNDDTSSLGDWIADETKFPAGISRLAQQIRQLGLQFGLWFEPEMVSRNSDLYRRHPDWCLQVPAYPATESRCQLVLDLTRNDVQDYLITVFRRYLGTGQVDYIKWDMNRHLTDVYAAELADIQQGEAWHRYVLGLYRILAVLTKEFPDVLFEGCSSGGGRFDPGMLYYMPQTWTSDNTDALSRVMIQNGYSLLYPPITLGAHVSRVPNQQVGRQTSLQTRFDVARFGNLGYELDLTKLSENKKQAIMEQISTAKQTRVLMQFGRFYRLETAAINYQAWLIINADQSEFNVLIFQKLVQPAQQYPVFKLHYLDPKRNYRTDSGQIFGGDELMRVGLTLPWVKADFYTYTYHFQAI
ncbi:MAG: alpha-galactosidase [Loigolactobacillus coryniformis]|nr:alpha-galactosidase [Loigolactobacillus coryniformis]